jgi:hypothetical protein
VDVKDWVIEFRGDKSPGAGGVALRTFYVLKNITVGKHVGYGRREYGVNLVWDAPLPVDDGNVRFDSRAGSGVLKMGEPVAVYVKGGGYLYYKEREYGINLEYSLTPAYQWEFCGDGSAGTTTPAKFRTNVSLYNSKTQDYVAYCKREYGINLRWARDCKPANHRP